MKAQPHLKTLMTPFPYSVDLDTPLGDAMALMEKHGVHHLPVTDENDLVGVISKHDMNAAETHSDDRGSTGLKVRDVYVRDAYVVDLNEPLDNVLLNMATRHIGSVLVTRKGKLVGVFTSNDACRCFGEYLRERSPRGHDDDVA